MTAMLVHNRWRLYLPPHRAARREWPWWEAARINAMYHYLKPGDVVYDIGAEEGDMSALWASWGCNVVLVEPNPKAWPCIRWTFEANDLTDRVVACWQGFCSDALNEDVGNDDGLLRLGSDANWPSAAYGEMVPDHGLQHLAEHSEVTPATTIDVLGARFEVPDAITIDVEGGEWHVLRGAVETLRAVRPLIFLSLHPEFMRDLYSENADELLVWIADHGYDLHYLATDHEIHYACIPTP